MTYKEMLIKRLPDASEDVIANLTCEYCVRRVVDPKFIPDVCNGKCWECWELSYGGHFPKEITTKILDKFNKLW